MLLLYISFKNKGFLFLISLPLFQVSWHIDIDSVNKNTKFGYYLSLIGFFVRNEKVSENSSNDLINSFNDIHNIATHPIGNSNDLVDCFNDCENNEFVDKVKSNEFIILQKLFLDEAYKDESPWASIQISKFTRRMDMIRKHHDSIKIELVSKILKVNFNKVLINVK